MSRPAKVGIALAVVTAFSCLICFLMSQREPAYNGRTLSQWLTLCRSSDTPLPLRAEATLAVRRIGTNGLTFLMRLASENPPQTRKNAGDYLDQHPMARRLAPKSLSAWVRTPPDQTRGNEARMGIMLLGADAAPAIPELTRLSCGPAGRQSTSWAIGTLGDMGPVALPALLTVLTNPAAPCRAYSAMQLVKLGTNAAPAVPILIALLSGHDTQVALSSADAIGDIGLSPDTCVPALTGCLHGRDRTLKLIAAESLRKFGPAAQSAIPDLRNAARAETDLFTRRGLASLLSDLQTLSGMQDDALPLSR